MFHRLLLRVNTKMDFCIGDQGRPQIGQAKLIHTAALSRKGQANLSGGAKAYGRPTSALLPRTLASIMLVAIRNIVLHNEPR
jgi:hypothetical protein